MILGMSRIRAVWFWLAEARHAGLAVGVVFVALAVTLRPNTPEPVIRLTGLVLQLLGVGTVIWGIAETRAFFGHPSYIGKAKSWISRFPLMRRNIVLSGGAGSFSTSTCKARGYVTQGPGGPNPTNEARIQALEKNIALLHDRISETQKEMDEEFGNAIAALRDEERARIAEDQMLHEKLEATGTGGVHISAIGALWLFIGVILSTAGIEIAQFLG